MTAQINLLNGQVYPILFWVPQNCFGSSSWEKKTLFETCCGRLDCEGGVSISPLLGCQWNILELIRHWSSIVVLLLGDCCSIAVPTMELQSSGGFHHVATCNPLSGEDIWTAEAEFRMIMMVVVAIIFSPWWTWRWEGICESKTEFRQIPS